ncbi:hypothetical protein [Variovorax sp. 278MFTsu5.1]|uniref:hypothetical protein n=1 Tax=Variovorax sp. 278MFTsu5.1 TaxID=3158366 RepID=UPI003AAE3BA1
MNNWEKFKYGLDTLAVVGTWGAIVVALHLSRAATKKAAREAEARAGLVAARHLAHLQSLYSGMKTLGTATRTFREGMSTSPELPIPLSKSWLENTRSIDLDVLSQLLPLPNYCASRIGKAMGDLIAIVEEMKGQQEVWRGMNAPMRAAWLDKWSARADTTAVTLQIAIEECAKAAKTHAPDFTATELGLA